MLSLYSLGGQGNIQVLFRKTTISSSMIWNFCEELCSRISMTQASVYVSTIGPITTLKIKKESVPLIADFFSIRCGKVFHQVGLAMGYYQVRIAEGDEGC
jgi:hypothetical protein